MANSQEDLASQRNMPYINGKPWLHVNLSDMTVQEVVQRLTDLIVTHMIEVLNVAGRSAVKDENIYDTVHRVMDGLLKYFSDNTEFVTKTI